MEMGGCAARAKTLKEKIGGAPVASSCLALASAMLCGDSLHLFGLLTGFLPRF